MKTTLALVVTLYVFAAGAGWAAHPVLAEKPEAKREETKPTANKADVVERVHKDYYGDPLPPGALARMGTVQLRHAGGNPAFSADGKTLISAGWDATVRFWDLATGKQARHTAIRLGVAISGLSPDGKVLAALGDERLYLYDTATSKERRRLPAEGIGHRNLVFSGDGKWLATRIGIQDNYTIRLWDAHTAKERLTLKRLSQVNALRLSSDGKFLAYIQGDEIHIVDTATRQELCKGRVGGHDWAFSPDGKLLASATYEGTVTLWQASDLKKLATFTPSPGVAGRLIQTPRLRFSPDGKRLAVGGLEVLVLWDVAAGKERLRLADRAAKELAFSADGKTLACAGEFEIRLWNTGTGERLHRRPGHDGPVGSVAVSPDGKIVASVAWTDPVIRLWDAATGKPLALSPKHDSWIRSVAFAADGRLVVSGGSGIVRLLDAGSGTELRRFVVTERKSGRQNQEILECH